MLSLIFANVNEKNIIQRISGTLEVRRHLENLGFVVGSEVSLISKNMGNVIVLIKGTRIGITEELARKIMI